MAPTHAEPVAPITTSFAFALTELIKRAGQQGRSHVEVNAGELHRSLGGYPGQEHRMPACCSAMRSAMTPEDKIIYAPDSGNGASLTIRYVLPRPDRAVSAS